MQGSSTAEEIDARRMVEAAAWRAHLTETNAQSSEAFEAWLRADERNAAAWSQVQTPWEFIGEHATSPELIELRRRALVDARTVGRQRWGGARYRWWRAVAAMVLATAAGVVLWAWNATRPDIYRTGVGERRVITLADGSQVSLDVKSEVRVHYSEWARDVALVKGQARFDVSHDVERPFSVVAADRKVVATGTSFNVDLLGQSLLVTLIEGRIVILPTAGSEALSARASRGGIELVSGERFIVSPTRQPIIDSVNLERATSWQNGELVFEDEPLASVVARVNRYSNKPLRLARDGVESLRISGVFHAGDTDGLVATITDYLPVGANRADDGSIELHRR